MFGFPLFVALGFNFMKFETDVADRIQVLVASYSHLLMTSYLF